MARANRALFWCCCLVLSHIAAGLQHTLNIHKANAIKTYLKKSCHRLCHRPWPLCAPARSAKYRRPSSRLSSPLPAVVVMIRYIHSCSPAAWSRLLLCLRLCACMQSLEPHTSPHTVRRWTWRQRRMPQPQIINTSSRVSYCGHCRDGHCNNNIISVQQHQHRCSVPSYVVVVVLVK